MTRSFHRAALAVSGLLAFAWGVAAAQPAAQLGALSPENLAKPRPAAPFDLTGTWQHELRGPQSWKFVPSTFELTPEAQAHYDAGQKALAENKVYRDDIGQCWPPGMPLIMTRVHPFVVMHYPTAIYMVSGFINSLRIIYLDGRTHSEPDIVVPSFNGESIGHFEGDTLVVETTNFSGERSFRGSGPNLRLTERFRRVADDLLLYEFTVDDPESFERPWTAQIPSVRVDGLMYEYACHEGNRGMFGILAGARAAEAQGER